MSVAARLTGTVRPTIVVTVAWLQQAANPAIQANTGNFRNRTFPVFR